MAKGVQSTPDVSKIVPTGNLIRDVPSAFVPNQNNPRRLFDPEPLRELKENIRQHGVLVPITVYRQAGTKKYAILDGARRHRCCLELAEEGLDVTIPAYSVAPPDRLTGTLYMFNIHNFREGWELVPTALSLKDVMDEVKEADTKKISTLTGLSEPQIERCKLILSFPEKYHQLSLDTNPTTRIPSNFWIEAHPVLDIAERSLPATTKQLGGRYGVTDRLVEKYRKKKIKSVIHFRRIVEAFENTTTDETTRKTVETQLDRFLLDVETETRELFDNFVQEQRKILRALEACREFRQRLEQIKIEHVVDKDELLKELKELYTFLASLIEKLRGEDQPEDSASRNNK